jgi:hypothetical protein
VREWAKPIIAEIHANGGLTGKNMDKFFELRFGHALETAGISPEYEIQGEADSTLDFSFTSKEKPWAVELMRLNETQAAKAATVELEDDGIAFVKRVLYSGGSDPRQSPEGETLKTIQRICQKCEQGGNGPRLTVVRTLVHSGCRERTKPRGLGRRIHPNLG